MTPLNKLRILVVRGNMTWVKLMNRRRVISALLVLGWFAAGIALPVHLSYANDHHDDDACPVCQALLVIRVATLLTALGVSLDRSVSRQSRDETWLAPVVIHPCYSIIPRGPPA